MPNSFRISLKSGERFYVNGAVLRTDRRVTLELLNEVSFLLEQHVMDENKARTPFERLYVLVQAILIDPARAEASRTAAFEHLRAIAKGNGAGASAAVIPRIADALVQGSTFEALKLIRLILPHEGREAAGPDNACDMDECALPRIVAARGCAVK